MNVPTLVAAVLVAVVFAAIVGRMLHNRRQGKCSCACGGDCGGCGKDEGCCRK